MNIKQTRSWNAPCATGTSKGQIQSLNYRSVQVAERRQSKLRAGDAISGEWAVNWSLSSYDDVSEYYSDQILNETVKPEFLLADVMKTDVHKLSPSDSVATIKQVFNQYTGAPVVDGRGILVGVVSRKDLTKEGATVGDIMTKKVVAMRPTAKVIDAASLMLKYKVHRVPVVDNEKKVLGIVTRTDVFESLPESSDSEIQV